MTTHNEGRVNWPNNLRLA